MIRRASPRRSLASGLHPKPQHRGQFPRQLNLKPIPAKARVDHHALDQAARRFQRRMAVRGVVQCRLQVGHLGAVDLREVGVQCRARARGGDHLALERALAAFQGIELLLQPLAAKAVGDRVDQPGELAVDRLQFALAASAERGRLGLQPVPLHREISDERSQVVGLHQSRAQRVQDQILQHRAADADAVGANALAACRAARQKIPSHRREGAATDAADELAGEQMLRAAALPVARAFTVIGTRGLPDGVKAQAGRIPQRVIDDPQFGHLVGHPGRCGVHARHPLAGRGVLPELHPVPDLAADIELVAQDAAAAQRVAADGGVAPGLALRARHAFGVERLGDRDRAAAAGEHLEDAAHHHCLVRLDGALAARQFAILAEGAHDAVAKAQAAGGFARLGAAAQPAVGLLRQVLEEQRVHRALEADMQLVDLALGVGDDPHPGEGQRLVEAGDVLLVARQPVERLGDQNVELAATGGAEHVLVAVAKRVRAAAGLVLVDADDLAANALRHAATKPNLVGNRFQTLQITAETGVYGSALTQGDLRDCGF